MAVRRYTPSIQRLQDDYSSEIARRWRRARRGPRSPGPKIMDNSEPWNADADTVEEFWDIANQINRVMRKWQLPG